MEEQRNVSYFRGVRIVVDPAMKGKKKAEMYEGDDEIRVSPAMDRLLKADPELMTGTLMVKILPKRIKERTIIRRS